MLDALEQALAGRRRVQGGGLAHHPDRRVQYACTRCQDALTAAGIRPSMSRRGNALDNAALESFFHTLETELVHHRTHATHDEARRDLFAYVEGWCNQQRLHSGLGYQTPAEAEQRPQGVTSTERSVTTPRKPRWINVELHRTVPSVGEVGDERRPVVIIHTAKVKPANAFTAIQYHGMWFWIGDEDFDSKVAFSIVKILLSFAKTSSAPGTVITIPAS